MAGMTDLAPNTLPHVHASAIKAYAVTALRRITDAPELPTVGGADPWARYHRPAHHPLRYPFRSPGALTQDLQPKWRR
jgi:hypothetical protein